VFFGKRDEARPFAIAVVRDVVEIVAIVAAGAWAFYVFAYENRIKPSLASPDVNITASLQNLGERNGLIAVRFHQELHNVGSVHAYFLGVAVTIYGQRVILSKTPIEPPQAGTRYRFAAFYRTSAPEPAFSLAYVTKLGDPSSSQETELDPGSTLQNDYVFYVPRGRFDLLTVQVNAVYTKFEGSTIPTHLAETPAGAVTVVSSNPSRTNTYNTNPLTSLNLDR
jgi:hypothetical protein